MTAQFCSSCGEPLEPGAHFCASCGHPIDGAPATQPAGTTDDEPAVAPAGPAPTAPAARPDQRRKVALYAVALLAVVALAVGVALFLNRPGGKSGELFLEAANSTGANPFTASTAAGPTTSQPTPPPGTATPTPTEGPTVVGTVDGNTAGLYGGTLNEASCDRDKQIEFLQANPDRAAAFAAVLGIATEQIPEYLGGLTPVVLRHDTRVTNHGFVDGGATAFQSVLQAGTAVLVDRHGVPRVRCMCGNPLTPPNAIEGDVQYRGQTWPGFSLNQTIVINNNLNIDIDVFVLLDLTTGGWFDRPTGTDGTLDKPGDGGGTTGGGTTGGGTTTGGGGGLSLCADSYEGAVNRLLGFRRADDRAGAMVCGTEIVLDYLWGLSDDFAGGLRIVSCEPGNKGELPANIQGYACTMSNNAIFVVELVPQGPQNWIVSYVALVDGGTTGKPPGTDSACGSSAESFDPTTPDEKLLVKYFAAVNTGDYAAAWSLLGERLRGVYGSQQEFADIMATHVGCVRVIDIKPLGSQEYQLSFAAEYRKPFPAGSGALQGFWTIYGGKIVDAGTGP